MDARDGILAVEIGERACDAQRAVIAARAERERDLVLGQSAKLSQN